MKASKEVWGYKVFGLDWTCRDYDYVGVGTTHRMKEGDVGIFANGFHFCLRLADCFSYYQFNPTNKVAQVVGSGEIQYSTWDTICCASTLTIVKELSWEEVLTLVNIGIGNSGFGNSGNYNSGSYNTGGRNSGNYNSGNSNSGHCNSGDRNSGDENSGTCNSGFNNSGNYNSGYYNSGNWNSGDYNSGDWNSGDYNSGVFCSSQNLKIKFFNRRSNWTYRTWVSSKARTIMSRAPRITSELSPEEKEVLVRNGYSIPTEIDDVAAAIDEDGLIILRQHWWDNVLSEDERQVVMRLPNFDAKIFQECTGIVVKVEEE